ncbi:zf-HC2 domain-containing protein [Chloroflexales bacterium ZM16-3]|nr:zf-HC2 domain-containing protein [Chloroflexales bacterium ZM16-3]
MDDYTGLEDELRCQELVELVTLYLERELGERDHMRFESHLAECEHCRIYLDQMRRTIWLTGQIRAPQLCLEERAQLLALFGGLAARPER